MITKPLLASPAELDLIRFPVLASPKFDGIRAVKVGKKMLSRSFKPIPNKFIQAELSNLIPQGMDGELMLRNPKATFQEITSAVMSIDGEPDFLYYAFDMVNNSDLIEPYHQRAKKLVQFVADNKSLAHWVCAVKPVLLKDRDALDAYEARCLEEGYEGVMIRDPQGKYKCGRSTTKEGILLKVKRFEDSECVILGFEERMKNTNVQERDELGHAKRSTAKAGMVPTGMLGALLVKDIKTGQEFSIGSGLDDLTRVLIWKNRPAYLNKIGKYKSQPTGVKEAPRFPVWLGLRDPLDMSE